MKIKVIVHEAEEGGFWAEVPAIPGCATEGETMDELIANLHEAIEGCLSVDVAEPKPGGTERILEIGCEAAHRARVRPACRTPWVATPAHQRKPSRLRQERQRRAPVDSHPRQPASEACCSAIS